VDALLALWLRVPWYSPRYALGDDLVALCPTPGALPESLMKDRAAWTDWAKHHDTISGTRLAPPKKPAKYRNVRVRIDGITFDSLREAARYGELKLLQGAGLIRDLEVHPVYALQVLELTEATAPPWVIHTVGTYSADFRYHVVVSGQVIIEDVKSPPTRTDLYTWKKKHVEAQYGILITEIE